MLTLKWTLVAAMAGLSTFTRAAAPAPVEDQPKDAIRLTVKPASDGAQVFVIGEGGEQPRGGLTYALDQVKREKGSYLGVSASSPPAVLRKQLGLSAGMGLVVEFVVPDSPAAHSGLQQYDVLQKLDDQLLVNQQQLAVLVRSHKPGEEVKLGVIRDGKATVLSAKLTEHELEPLAGENEVEEGLFRGMRWMPDPRVRTPLPGQIRAWGELRPGVQPGPSSTTWLEDGKSYTIAAGHDGKKTFVVKDKDAKVVFQGPIDTQEQRDKLSPELKEKLENMRHRMPGVGAVKGGFNPWTAQPPATQPRKKADKDADEK